MNGRVAKRLRRENPVSAPKRFFKAITVPIPTQKFDEDGVPYTEDVETYIPRKQRRMIKRKIMSDFKKGRLKR